MLDKAWAELELDALASDGPIKDADVKNAIRRQRPHIEAAVVTYVLAYLKEMRKDHRTIPHGEFYKKWPDWKKYTEILPSYCGCRDCQLWRSGS